MKKEEIRIEYQRKHPNCEYCVWYKYHSPSLHWVSCADFTTCDLKDQMIYFPKIKAKFCKQFIIKEDIDEI